MAYSPYMDKSNPGARESLMLSRQLPDPGKTSVDCRAKSIKRSLGSSRKTKLLRSSPSSRRPASRKALRSACAAASQIHVGFEGCRAHVFGRKARLHMFPGARREPAAGGGPEA